MAVNTLSNFIAAVNATVGASGSVYNVASVDSVGTIFINRAPSASGSFVLFAKVFYSVNPDYSVITDSNPSGAQVIIKGNNSGQTDIQRYCDAQGFINQLAAN
jgi:hypothetical protein